MERRGDEVKIRVTVTAAMVSSLVAVVFQLGIWVWWGSSFVARTELKLKELEGMPERLARIEEGQRYTIRILESIEKQVAEQRSARR